MNQARTEKNSYRAESQMDMVRIGSDDVMSADEHIRDLQFQVYEMRKVID